MKRRKFFLCDVKFTGKKSVAVTAKLIFVTVKRLVGNEPVNEGMSRNQPK